MYRRIHKKERKQLRSIIMKAARKNDLIWSDHALQRMQERNIPARLILETLGQDNMSLIPEYTVAFSRNSIRTCISSMMAKVGEFPIHIVVHVENGTDIHVVTCYVADDTTLYDEKGLPLKGLPVDIIDILKDELTDSLAYFTFLCAQPINLQGETLSCIDDILKCFSYGLPLALGLLDALYEEAIHKLQPFAWDLSALYDDELYQAALRQIFDNPYLEWHHGTSANTSARKQQRTMNLCFDLDDTLYDLAQPFYTTMYQFFPQLKTGRFHMEKMYQEYRVYGDGFFNLIQAGVITPDDSGILRIEALSRQYHLDLDLLSCWDFQQAYRQHQYEIQMSSQLYAFLKDLPARLAVLTNGNDTHQMAKAHALQLETIVPEAHIFTSQAVGYRKPDPRAFEAMLSKVGGSAQDWFYIGDSYDNDMVGARAAGMKTIHFNRHRQKEGPASDYTVYTEEELMELLETIQRTFYPETMKGDGDL